MPSDHPFIIMPTERARAMLRTFDPSLLEEVRLHAAIIAADPAGELVRVVSAHGLEDRYEYAYDSRCASGLRVVLAFADLDLTVRRAVLVGVVVIGTIEE